MHIWIHFKEEKKLSNTFGRYSENFTKIIEYLIELWPLLFERFHFFEWCLSAKNKTIRSISMRKSILWLISHLHTIENTILDKGPILRNTNQFLCVFAGKIFNKHPSKHEKCFKGKGHNSIKYSITFVKFSEFLPNVLLNFFSSLKCIQICTVCC